MEFLTQIDFISLVLLAIFAFLAGFLDAIVGGGGLIQLPVLLIQFPNTPIATLMGTNKIAAFSGTFTSAVRYAKRIKFDFRLISIIGFLASISSFFGAKLVLFVDVNLLKPVILIILILILVYTFFKKDLGKVQTHEVTPFKKLIYGSSLSIILGFYDGFFGPGTGSFFVLGFIVLLGFDFLHASAYAKVVNSITNISALIVFLYHGNYILSVAIIMAISNIFGNVLGTKTAFKKGNSFIRILFIVVVSLLIIRYAFDIFQLKF